MKLNKLTSVILVIIGLTLTNITSAKDYSNKQFTLFNYQFEISKDFRKEIKLLDSYLRDVDVVDTKVKDKLKAVIIHHIYYAIKDKLEEDIQMEILPANSFLSKIKYNEFNYPSLTQPQAVRHGDSRYYFKVSVNIETVTEEQQKLNPDLFENINQVVTMPKVTVIVDLYTKDGIIPVDKWEGFATATKPILIDKKLLGSYDPKAKDKDEPDEELTNLSSIVNRAIENMVQSVYKKK